MMQPGPGDVARARSGGPMQRESMLVLRHEQLDRAHSGLGRASMGPGKETPGWPAGGVDTIWLLLGRSSLVGLVKRTMRRPQIWMPAATNAIERLPVPAAQAPLGCDVLLLADGASTTGCSPRTPPTISVCVCVFQRDGVVVSLRPSLPASAVARPDEVPPAHPGGQARASPRSVSTPVASFW